MRSCSARSSMTTHVLLPPARASWTFDFSLVVFLKLPFLADEFLLGKTHREVRSAIARPVINNAVFHFISPAGSSMTGTWFTTPKGTCTLGTSFAAPRRWPI